MEDKGDARIYVDVKSGRVKKIEVIGSDVDIVAIASTIITEVMQRVPIVDKLAIRDSVIHSLNSRMPKEAEVIDYLSKNSKSMIGIDVKEFFKQKQEYDNEK